MEDPTGFLRYQRFEAGKQFPRSRIRHWHEYEQVMPVAQASVQARRCMDCGTPHCHRYCPVHNLIPDWNSLLSEDDWRAAWAQLESTNNFPEFTGRICSAPCEDACTLSINSRPVTIRQIELAIAERAWRSGWIKPQPPRRKLFQRVAIIGSGPAGLACAQQLARAGYRVTVYEKSDRIGGLLRYGIPDFRLDKRALDRRLAQLHAEGVRFRHSIHVGVDLDFTALHRSSHAVVLACGAQQPRTLAVPGMSLNGIHYAMDYLTQQNRRVAGEMVSERTSIDARDKQVVILGGGDTGGDCVGTAIRQGAREVTQVQYHERPPPHLDNLRYWPQPVPEWHANDHDAEGCQHIWGYDTVAFTGKNGELDGLRLQKLRWMKSPDGRWQKQHLPGHVRLLPAQLVLLALGYSHPVHAGLLEQLSPGFDARGNIAAPQDSYMTGRKGVFACGDARRGQSLVVWAIREGRQCAHAVDRWLSGESQLPAV
jgi:glutamate synthase (NADPH/NADH) small chain